MIQRLEHPSRRGLRLLLRMRAVGTGKAKPARAHAEPHRPARRHVGAGSARRAPVRLPAAATGPADPAAIVAGPTASPELVEQIRKDLGLDRPVIVQFGIYLARVLQGDLGVSLISNTSVVAELGEAIGPTAELMFACLVWAVPLGIALGTIAAVYRGRLLDRIVIAISVAGVSTPVFFIGLILMQYIGYHWGLLPFIGRGGPLWSLDGLAAIALPALTLGLVFIGPIARMTRTAALEVLSADHVRTARAKGLSERAVVLRHVLRNALIPVVTLIGCRPAICSAAPSSPRRSIPGPASAGSRSARSSPAISRWRRARSWCWRWPSW